MKRTICAAAAIAGMLYANVTLAQDTEKKEHSRKRTISISNKGIHFSNEDSTASKDGKESHKHEEKTGKLKLTYMLLDLGVNMLNDNTVYTDPSVVNYLNVPAANRNENIFDLRQGKSINVNINPLMVKLPLVSTKGQRLYLSTGIGLQIYNFRYENNISYKKDPNGIIMDTIGFKKNKLAINYGNIPLMMTAKTRVLKDTWLVYGVGVSAGYRLSSWNKQVSDARGKVKNHGNFDLADYNTCLTAEFGVEGILRFYASYQLNSIYDNAIDQRPICVGVRIGGI